MNKRLVPFIIAFIIGTSAFSQIDSLDLKIGQMLLVGFPTAGVDSTVLEEVRAGKVGSLIIFEKNIPPSNSFVALKKITWTYQKAAPIPLIIGIDQEGGRVNRLKSKYGFPNSITASAMSKAPSLDSVHFYGESTAATLAGLGINMNFAPVVDLAINPTNPIIAKYGRAFSANEDSVILMAKEYIKEHRRYGVLTSLKHFPGHGSSKSDTHLGIADVTNTWEERELAPYKILIDSGYADAIMTSHIVNKQLEPEALPGTLSDDIIGGILRKRLHFNGVIFTDDMQMHAISKNYGVEDAIRLAVKAGVDIMTFSNNIAGTDLRTVDMVHGVIRKMVESGEIPKSRIDESFKRIMKLKKFLQDGSDKTALWQELSAARAALEKSKQEYQELKENSRPLTKREKRKLKKK